MTVPNKGECWVYTNFDYTRTHWVIIDVIGSNVIRARIIAHDGWDGITSVGTVSHIGVLESNRWSLCKKHRFYASLRQILEAENPKNE